MLNAFHVGLHNGTEGETAQKHHHYFKQQGWGCEWQGFSEEDVLFMASGEPWISSPPHFTLIPATS